jgi:hypothetical protein
MIELIKLFWSSLRTTPLFYIALGASLFLFPWSQFDFFESLPFRYGFFFSLGVLVATLFFCYRDAERHFQLQEQINAGCEEASRTGRTVEIETINGTIWIQPSGEDDDEK